MPAPPLQKQKPPKTLQQVILISLAYVVAIKVIQLMLCSAIYYRTDGAYTFVEYLKKASDCNQYMGIAEFGYQTSGENAIWIAFFPLYPYILKIFGFITGEYFWTGSLLSMAFLTVGGVYVFLWQKENHDEKTALRTLKYFMLFPMQFFSMLPMSEGLFVMLVAMYFYYLEKKNFLALAAVGLFASLTRSCGIFLALLLGLRLLSDFIKCKNYTLKEFGKLILKATPAIASVLGLLIYLKINHALFGDMFKFSYFQETHWHQSLGFFGNTISTMVEYFHIGGYEKYCLWGFQLVVIFFALILLLLVARRNGEHGIYSAVQMVFMLSAQWLLSAPRYLLPILPIYSEMSQLAKNAKWDIAITALLAAASIFVYFLYLLSGKVY